MYESNNYSSNQYTWNVAIYVRLSREDEKEAKYFLDTVKI